jgi:hypothetical protein
MAQVDLGKVKGEDGFDPEVEEYENTFESYRLRITDSTHSFLTPNLRGATFKSHIVEIWDTGVPTQFPFGDLGLDPAKSYMFYATAGIDYPPLRGIIAIRVGDAVQVSVYTDTIPYTTPQLGSPFPSAKIKIGQPDLVVGNFTIGVQTGAESFPVNLLCFEVNAATQAAKE